MTGTREYRLLNLYFNVITLTCCVLYRSIYSVVMVRVLMGEPSRVLVTVRRIDFTEDASEICDPARDMSPGVKPSPSSRGPRGIASGLMGVRLSVWVARLSAVSLVPVGEEALPSGSAETTTH